MLSVLEARSSDSGIYVCEAVNEGGRAQQAYTLEILGISFQYILPRQCFSLSENHERIGSESVDPIWVFIHTQLRS